MDTREKIITAESALAIAEDFEQRQISFKIVTGYFDVLQPAMLRRLQEYAREDTRLFAVVLHLEEALLSDAARAELAAGLRVIDYVIPSPRDPSNLLAAMQPERLIREEPAHRDSTEQLIEHVFERHALERKRRSVH